VEVVKLLITKFSLVSFYFFSLRTTYSSQHPVLKQLQSVFPLLGQTKFQAHTKLQAKLQICITRPVRLETTEKDGKIKSGLNGSKKYPNSVQIAIFSMDLSAIFTLRLFP
jgi:hypothetical protein